jgi:predicted permease
MWRPFGRTQRDFDDEVQAHLELETDHLIADGMSPTQARDAARRAFGNVTRARERFYESSRATWLETTQRNVRYALRTLARSPGFTAAALLTLACGTGLNTALFTLLYSLALRPLPLRDADRVVKVFQRVTSSGGRGRQIRGSPYFVSFPEYTEYRDRNRTLDGLAAYSEIDLTLAGETATPVRGVLVSCDYFHVLRAQIARGRSFAGDECRAGAPASAVIVSHGFWQRQLGADTAAIGRSITLGRQRLTIIGIAEPGFTGTEVRGPDLWAPLYAQALLGHNAFDIQEREVSWLSLVGRLKPGVSRATALADLVVVATQTNSDVPDRRMSLDVSAGTYLAGPEVRRRGAGVAIAVLAMSGLVLAMACANVMGLLLARAVARRREIAIRLSLGASRGQLITQLATESLLVGLMGGAIGTLLAAWLPPVLVARLGEQVPGVDLSPDLLVLVFALGISMLAALTFGLVPAFEATRLQLNAALRSGGVLAASGRMSRSRLRTVIVGVQVAGSALLLVAAALLARGVTHAERIDPGYVIDGVVDVSLDLARQGYDPPRAAALLDEFVRRLAVVPGVQSVARVTTIPLGGYSQGTIRLDQSDPPQEISVLNNTVSASYFRSLDISIVRGRAFTDDEGRDPVSTPVVVSDAMARRFWPTRDPLGAGFRDGTRSYVVVGVAKDVESKSLGETDGPLLYVPLRPSDALEARLLVRASNPAALVPVIGSVARSLDANLLVTTDSFAQRIERMMQPVRLLALLASLMGLLAAALAVIGVYGVVSYDVSQRSREIGLRSALGALPRDVLALVLRRGGRVVVVGVVVGLVLAAPAALVLRAALFGLAPLDAPAFLGAALIVFVAAIIAMLEPARRALRVDPAVALRAE